MPDHASIQQLLADATAKYHSGDYRQAIQLWQKILLSEPANQKAKEGIRMASLLLEEAQAAAAGGPVEAGTSGEAPESQENIARVREGIQAVRNHLAASKYLEAMEVCQSLLALAPRSAAVHEIVEEAREAYEAQPFIHEHLVIAQQLFVQERLAEASAELHKIFFLNPNHGEARRLEAKIVALKQKAVPPTAQLEPLVSQPEPPGPDPAQTQRLTPPPDFGDSLDLSGEAPPAPAAQSEPAAGSPDASAAAAPSSAPSPDQPAQVDEWETELAQLTLGGPSAAPAAEAQDESAGKAETPAQEKLEILGLSEGPVAPTPPAAETSVPLAMAPEEPAAEAIAPEASSAAEPEAPTRGEVPARKTTDDLDLSSLMDEEEGVAPRPSPERGVAEEKIPARRPPERELPARMPARRGVSIMKYALPLLGIVIGGGAAWWFFGVRSASSGSRGNPPPPPAAQARQSAPGPVARHGSGGGANLGLSSSGSSKPSESTASAGLSLPAPGPGAAPPPSPPALSAEQTRQEIARLSAEGHASMGRGKYQDAVKAFSRILDLDPANMEAKDQMDQATSKILEQKRLEEDVQTAKEFFVEKDYESALRKFYRLPRDRNLGDLDLFIRNAWYNWAVVSMKGGNCVEALKRLQEALNVDPNDEEAIKSQEVAEHYKDRPKDKVFYAFTDRITYRTLNQK